MRGSSSAILISLFVFLSCFAVSNADDLSKEGKFSISWGSESIVPANSYRAEMPESARNIVLQFYELPDTQRRTQLEKAGFRLHRYIGGNAYIARKNKSSAELSSVDDAVGIRAVLNLTPEMKTSRIFKENAELSRRIQAGEVLGFHIRFFPGVTLRKATDILESGGISIKKNSFKPGRSLEIECPWSGITDLLSREEVEWIDPAAPARKLMNKIAARRSNVNYVCKSKKFRNANGKSSTVGVWDGGPIDNHPDLQDRITIIENELDVNYHATHVAGTIAGSGLGDPTAQGMAPAAKIYSYDFQGNVVREMRSAVKKYGVAISSNSWGSVNGWQYYRDPEDESNQYYFWAGDWMFGYYHNEQVMLDNFIRKSDILVVFAAGNDRGDTYIGPHKHEAGDLRVLGGYVDSRSMVEGQPVNEGDGFHEDIHPSDPEYSSVSTWACAKNNLTVGATMKDDVMTGFSGWGPTDDGRVKPDVVTNGYGLNSTYLNGEYRKLSGTSMATPTASGTAALLSDYYYRRHKKRISALSLKNLLIHSARDLGRPGPDYTFGHGIVDGEMGARIIKMAVFNNADLTVSTALPARKHDYDAKMRSLMIEDSLDNKKRHKYYFAVPQGAKELRATLVWHDPGGSKLVNNLDLVAAPNLSEVVKPFILDAGNPEAAAKTGRNKVDNVESIKIKSPKAGSAEIIVIGKKIPEGPQRYSLIVSASDGNRVPATKSEGWIRLDRVFSCKEREQYAENNQFTTGDDFYALAQIFVMGNAVYGGYYGSVGLNWQITNQANELIMNKFSVFEDYGPTPAGEYTWGWMGSYKIPGGLPKGNYTIRSTITMHNGRTVSKSYDIVVN